MNDFTPKTRVTVFLAPSVGTERGVVIRPRKAHLPLVDGVAPIQGPRQKRRCRVCDGEDSDVCAWCGPDEGCE